MVHIESLILNTHHLQLLFLHGETGIDEEHSVFLRVILRAEREGSIAALHASHDGYAALSVHIQTDEGLDEARSLMLQGGQTLDVGILTGNAITQGIDLSLNANLGSRQTGDAHLHLDKLHAGLALGILCYALHLANGGSANILDVIGFNGIQDNIF